MDWSLLAVLPLVLTIIAVVRVGWKVHHVGQLQKALFEEKCGDYEHYKSFYDEYVDVKKELSNAFITETEKRQAGERTIAKLKKDLAFCKELEQTNLKTIRGYERDAKRVREEIDELNLKLRNREQTIVSVAKIVGEEGDEGELNLVYADDNQGLMRYWSRKANYYASRWKLQKMHKLFYARKKGETAEPRDEVREALVKLFELAEAEAGAFREAWDQQMVGV